MFTAKHFDDAVNAMPHIHDSCGAVDIFDGQQFAFERSRCRDWEGQVRRMRWVRSFFFITVAVLRFRVHHPICCANAQVRAICFA